MTFPPYGGGGQSGNLYAATTPYPTVSPYGQYSATTYYPYPTYATPGSYVNGGNNGNLLATVPPPAAITFPPFGATVPTIREDGKKVVSYK